MKRSYNSTGRKKILHSMVAFDFERDQNGLPVSFNADLSGLKELGLPATADVIVEPFYKHSAMRFDFGKVASIAAPSNRNLNEIDAGGEIMFRVKVVDNSQGTLGRLVASGDRFSSTLANSPNESRIPILPVKPEAIGEKIWDVSTANSATPYLLVNNRIPELTDQIASNPLLRGAVLVEAFRKILAYMITKDADEVQWFDKWKTFLTSRLGVDFPEEFDSDDENDREEIAEFIENTVNVFAQKFQFATAAIPSGDVTEVPND